MAKHLSSIWILFLTLSAVPQLAMGSNYERCLLDKLPDVQNDQAVIAATSFCYELPSAKQGSGRGIFSSFKSSNECILGKASSTRNRRAAMMIASACRKLYDKPVHPAQQFKRPPQPTPNTNQQAVAPSTPLPSSAPPPNNTLAADTHYQQIYTAYPDADALVSEPDFTRWASSPARQRVMTEGTSDEVIALFSEYRTHKARKGKSPLQSSGSQSRGEPQCEFKAVMTNADYHACGLAVICPVSLKAIHQGQIILPLMSWQAWLPFVGT